MSAKKGDWVQIYFIALNPEERTANIPEDTKKVPLEVRIKGFLNVDKADIGDEVEIVTPVKRKVKGKLEIINPEHKHNFGLPLKELLNINIQLQNIMMEDDNNE